MLDLENHQTYLLVLPLASNAPVSIDMTEDWLRYANPQVHTIRIKNSHPILFGQWPMAEDIRDLAKRDVHRTGILQASTSGSFSLFDNGDLLCNSCCIYWSVIKCCGNMNRCTAQLRFSIIIDSTSQLNTSQPDAIHELALLPNVNIKVFKANTPTFHAKEWLFAHLDKTPEVAIVESSNVEARNFDRDRMEMSALPPRKSYLSFGRSSKATVWESMQPLGERMCPTMTLRTAIGRLYAKSYLPRWRHGVMILLVSAAILNAGNSVKSLLDSRAQWPDPRKFENGKEEGPRKRARPLRNSWNLPQYSPPKKFKSEKY